MRPFGATNKPETCPWCGRKYPGLGTSGRRRMYGPFDTLACAERFARQAYINGLRFKPFVAIEGVPRE